MQTKMTRIAVFLTDSELELVRGAAEMAALKTATWAKAQLILSAIQAKKREQGNDI